MKFYKYHGAGNDFIMIDNREMKFDYNQPKLIQQLCHRRFGIGADGIIALENDEASDFRMLYFNADGYEGSMCGNGGRCIVAFAKQLEIISNKTKFNACDGLHFAEIDEQGLVDLKMIDIDNVEQRTATDFVLDTGSPHYVQIVKSLVNFDVEKEGKAIRHSDEFNEAGINVNFVSIKEAKTNSLILETFERGVEAVTYACGTGATAAAICYAIIQKFTPGKYKVSLQAKGGLLSVTLKKTANGFENIWLKGPAEVVFEGEF